ncbi:MAG TPA: hypothetical protein PKO06_11630 [Candidatus Ozemobacteraceae bacterium]|nr:hypothetical protein [Candidatus Ozemobacteraceae bacterium]
MKNQMLNWRLLIISCVCALWYVSGGIALAEDAPPFTAQRQIKRLETALYGKNQTGNWNERLNRIELDLLGRETGLKVADRSDMLVRFLFKGTETAPSMEMKLGFLEWKLFHETRQGTVADRIAAIAKQAKIKSSSEPLVFRLEQLVQAIVDNGYLTLHKVKLPAGSSVRVRLSRDVSSNQAREGDLVPVSVVRDTFIDDNVLVVAKGGIALGEVEKVRRSGRFGRSGNLAFAIRELHGLDGSSIPVVLKDSAFGPDQRKPIGMAVGASALGYLALGPVGLAGGVFVKGKEMVLPQGLELVMSTTEDVWVVGIVVNRR